MRKFIKIVLLLLPLAICFGQNAFGQPSNYYWDPVFAGSGVTMNNDAPVIGIVSHTIIANSSANQFNLQWDSNYNKWYNSNTPFNQEYIVNFCGGCSSQSDLLSNPTSGHYYTLQVEGLAYSNRNAVLMETTNAPQSFAASDPVTPATPSIAPGQDLNLTITLAGNKSPEEKAFVRYSIDGFTTNNLAEVSFATSTSSSGTAVIPGSYNTTGINVSFYVYTTTVSAITTSNHDLITLKLANNSGSNYNYTVKSNWKSIANGNWNDPNTWETNAVPGDRQDVLISSGTTVIINIDTVKISTLELESSGELTGNTNTTVVFPGGGWTTTFGGIFKPYNLVIGENIAGGPLIFYVNNDFEIQNDLTILQNGKLQPGGSGTPTITMSGLSGSFLNEGLLDSNPNLLNTAGEKLKFIFSGNTVLRGNGGAGGDKTKFSDITIPLSGALTADAAGVLNAELQFGVLECDGVFNMSQAGPGFVNFTLRGESGNTYNLKSANPNQIFQFHNLIIGNSDSGIVKLGLDNSSEDVEMRVSGDFENFDLFESTNGINHIKAVFNGPGNDQIIRGQISQTVDDKIEFSELEINNQGGTVTFKTNGGDFLPEDNILISISGNVKLTNGRLVTFDSSVPARHKLLLQTAASIDYSGAQSSDTEPCYIEGPISYAFNSGNGQEFFFPVGQEDDYRLLKIGTDASTTSEFTVEGFKYSPADFPGMTLENPTLNISGVRFWNIKTTDVSSTTNTQITVDYGDYLTDGVNSESDLRLVWAEEDASTDVDPSNNTWKSLGPSGGGNSNSITSNAFDFDTLSGKIDITLGNVGFGVNPLPVTWLYFYGNYTYAGNELEWATGSETNNAYFEIERSLDARNFEVIGQVSSYGDSNTEQIYDFTDRFIESTLYYYRIRQVDLDGKSETSRIISLSHSAKADIYPNPFVNKMTINLINNDTEGVFQIMDASGKVILEQNISMSTQEIQTSRLAPGIYTGRLFLSNRDPEIIKLVKSR